MIRALTWLDEANNQIAEARQEVETGAVEGDFLYNGDLEKWQKAINSYHLRLLINFKRKSF